VLFGDASYDAMAEAAPGPNGSCRLKRYEQSQQADQQPTPTWFFDWHISSEFIQTYRFDRLWTSDYHV
jgi:hypothetical protein